MIEGLKTETQPADDVTRAIQRVGKSYIADPGIVYHKNGLSDVAGKFVKYKNLSRDERS